MPREVTKHTLKIHSCSKQVKQHLRRFDEEKHRAISEEIAKLSATGFIKEVYHPKWLVESFEPTKGINEILIDPSCSEDKVVSISTTLSSK